MGVRETLLALMTSEPKYGYQLKADYESVASPSRPLNVGQVYTTLDRLVRDGLVEEAEAVAVVGGDDRRRPYQLTATGRAEALAWFFEAPVRPRSLSSDVAEKVLVAMEAEDVRALDVVRAQRARLVDELRPLRRAASGAATGATATADVVQRLTDDWKASLIEGELGWLDRAEELLVRVDGDGNRNGNGNTKANGRTP